MLGSATVSSQLTPASLVCDTVDLVTLPEVYLKVRELLDDPDSSMVDIADAICVDLSLTGRILRIANSAFCGFSAAVQTVPHAVSLLGTQLVHDLVLSTSVARAFSGVPEGVVDMQQFWRNSVLCGIQAKVIAEHSETPDSGHMFTVGLLAHVGRMVLYLRLPAVMDEAHMVASEECVSISQALERKLGFDDAAVAGELLSSWNLPQSIAKPVAEHTHPPSVGEEGGLETVIVHVASVIADLGELDVDGDELIGRFDETAWSVLKLDRETLSDLKSNAEELASEIAGEFLPAEA
jgi:HD-like signal output (HDOD) protein